MRSIRGGARTASELGKLRAAQWRAGGGSGSAARACRTARRCESRTGAALARLRQGGQGGGRVTLAKLWKNRSRGARGAGRRGGSAGEGGGAQEKWCRPRMKALQGAWAGSEHSAACKAPARVKLAARRRYRSRWRKKAALRATRAWGLYCEPAPQKWPSANQSEPMLPHDMARSSAVGARGRCRSFRRTRARGGAWRRRASAKNARKCRKVPKVAKTAPRVALALAKPVQGGARKHARACAGAAREQVAACAGCGRKSANGGQKEAYYECPKVGRRGRGRGSWQRRAAQVHQGTLNPRRRENSLKTERAARGAVAGGRVRRLGSAWRTVAERCASSAGAALARLRQGVRGGGRVELAELWKNRSRGARGAEQRTGSVGGGGGAEEK